MVNHPEANGERAGHPGIGRVFRIQIALNDALAFHQVMVHHPQKLRIDQIISVKHRYRVILLGQLEQIGKAPLHGKAFAALDRVNPFKHCRAGPPGHFRSPVGAIVSHDKNVVESVRIIQDMKIFNQLPDDVLFIMGGN